MKLIIENKMKMKELSYIKSVLLLLMVYCLYSCEESEIMVFDSMPSVYFQNYGVGSEKIDTTHQSFTKVPGNQVKDTVYVRLRLLGKLYEDSPFSVRILDSSTALKDVHYEALSEEYIFPANTSVMYIPIYVNKTEDMANQQDTIALSIGLEENEFFNLDFVETAIYEGARDTISTLTHTVVFSNFLVRPEQWTDGGLGTYSVTKFKLLIEITGYPASQFDDNDWFTFTRGLYLGTFLQNYLDEQADAGNVILDEDGEPMEAGPYVQ